MIRLLADAAARSVPGKNSPPPAVEVSGVNRL